MKAHFSEERESNLKNFSIERERVKNIRGLRKIFEISITAVYLCESRYSFRESKIINLRSRFAETFQYFRIVLDI